MSIVDNFSATIALSGPTSTDGMSGESGECDEFCFDAINYKQQSAAHNHIVVQVRPNISYHKGNLQPRQFSPHRLRLSSYVPGSKCSLLLGD